MKLRMRARIIAFKIDWSIERNANLSLYICEYGIS